jgi:DivIVA domain-containing protein
VIAMHGEKISLTPQDILDKEFKIDARGYRPQEVDKFLDQIMGDYNEFITMIKDYRREVGYLTEENNKLKNELRRLRSSIETAESVGQQNNNVSNIDLLRRLSQLETVVYGKKEEK